MYIKVHNCNYISAATVSFEFTNYTVPENVGKMHAVLVLSRPLSTTVRVRVNTRDGTAIGEYINDITLLYCI